MTKRLSAAVIKNSFVWREGYSGGRDTESNTQRFILSSLIEDAPTKPPLASIHLKLLKDTTSTKLIQALRCEELEHGGKSAAKCYQVIAREQDILHVFKELGPTHVQILASFNSVQLLIHKDAILDLEVGVGEASNGTRHFQEFLITLCARHLINQEGNSCNYHPNGCNFHCRIGAIVDLNTKKKQNRSNTCWFQLPKFENFLLFCFSLSFMKANEESFGF